MIDGSCQAAQVAHGADSQFNARGIVAMANSGPDTNKSQVSLRLAQTSPPPLTHTTQFFITYAKQPSLDGKYTIFGKVIDGSDTTLETMERVPVNEKNRPTAEFKVYNVSFRCVFMRDWKLMVDRLRFMPTLLLISNGDVFYFLVTSIWP